MNRKGRLKGMKFRTRKQMRLAVLKSLSPIPLLRSHVAREANLRNAIAIEILDELIEEGLVAKKMSKYRQGKTTVPVRTMFSLTPKGIEELSVKGVKAMTECKREGCSNDISVNPYWGFIGYCSRRCHLRDLKEGHRKGELV